VSDAGLDLDYDDGQRAIAASVAAFCAARWDDAAARSAGDVFPMPLWRELAGLGVLALATPEGEGGALEVAAAMESLGRAVFPGPLAASFLAARVLGADEARAVASGEALVAFGEPPLLPFAPLATLFIEVCGERLFRGLPVADVEPVATLGGEPWGRVALARGAELDGAASALALHDAALAAYLAAAGRRLLDAACDHARTRRQFGRPIGDFQAVAHPLADAAMALDAATLLARAAAFRIDAGDAQARGFAAAARASAARAAVEAAHTAHQAFGAIGVTRDGPAFHVSRRIRQLASAPPHPAAAQDRVLGLFGL
jgi:alkylation response protein AidB-like acyl-CoA dehydrogenase